MGAAKVRTPTQPGDGKRQRARPHWAGAFFLVTALIVPLVYSGATIDPVLPLGFLVVSLLGVVLVTAFGVNLVRSPQALAVSRAEAIVLGCLAATLLVTGVSLLVAGPTPDGNFELLKWATFAWLIFASSRAIQGERSSLALLARCVTLASFVVGGFAVLQYYQVAIFEWMKQDTTVDSTMAHRNLLASFVVLAFPFVAYGFLELGGFWRVASAATGLITVFLVIVLQTRSVWVAVPCAVASNGIVLTVVSKRARLPRQGGRHDRRRWIQGAALTALGICIALLFYSPRSRAPMREHAASIVQLRDASIHERFQLWSRTLRMIEDHPLTGVGPGNWRIVIPTYGAAGMRSDTGTLHFQRPHNDFLWVASETGIVGGILYLAVFASVLVLGVAAMVRATTMHDRLVLTLLLFGVSGAIIDALFSFPMERVAHTVYLALSIGAVLSLHGKTHGRAWRAIPRRAAIALVVLVWVATVLAGRVAWSRYRAEVHLRRALEARATQSWPLMVSELDHIDSRFYVIDPSSAPVAWYRGVAHFEMGDTTAAFADFRRALAVHPNHVHVLNNIGTCQTLRGEFDAAVRSYERAIELAPRFEEARVNLGFLLHSLGRDPEAHDVLMPLAAEATSPRFVECWRAVRAALGLEK